MQKKLELFKGLFQPFNNISILHITNNIDFISPTLKETSDSLEGVLKTIDFIDENSARLKPAREYEYIVLSDVIFYCLNKDKILKSLYKALENSANIIILEKKENKNLDEIKRLLDESSFVAINNIELFDEYNLITAKKLHMWDAGL